MWIQQVFVALACVLLAAQQITAVVNNAQANTSIESDSSSSAASETNSASKGVADSVAASTDTEANRRDAPLGDAYGAPLADSYAPLTVGNPSLPVPVYGVPDAPTNNIVYPGPPPDIPPPLQSLPLVYGPPKEVYGPPKDSYGLPAKYGPPPNFPRPPKPFNPPPFKLKPLYGPPPPQYGPPPHKPHFKPLKPIYGPPKPQYGPPKSEYGPPKPEYGPPKLQYGPPKPEYGPPKFEYGPPKPQYGPPKSTYGVPKPIYGPPQKIPHLKPIYGPPKDSYGPPKFNAPPLDHYGVPNKYHGPPDAIPHGPPYPGVGAPPTPPDIKYDGWQPIPGLVSRPPSDSYGVPHGDHHGNGDLQFNGDFVPPPVSGGHGISSLSLGSSYGSSAGISDSYGAPLNTVTGSGGIVSTSGDAHIHNQDQNAISLGLSAAGIGSDHGGQLSVVKSIGYEIFPHGASVGGGDTYTAPPSNSYAVNGPYAASHFYHNKGSSSFSSSSSFGKGLSLSSSGIGLIPPSGVYGVPPSGQYGTPLLGNSLDISPPKQPILFREPVPPGFIQSIGDNVAHKDAAGIIEHSAKFNGPTHIPPPVYDITFDEHKGPSNLYSLPHTSNPVSFQSVSHNFNENSGAHAEALTSYSASLGSVDGNYGSSSSGVSVSLDHSLPAATIDLTHYGVPSFSGGLGHDCAAHKSQPLPQLSYGVPSANSYTASLSTLKTNIGGGSYPSLVYGTPDLQAAHSLQTSISNGASINSIEETSKEQYGKSLTDTFAPGGELIKSQSIDFSNIPIQGALGSYTLQIQAADGVAGADPSSQQVPHDQVLNDGLLQSILAAIEHPNQKSAHVLGQPLLTLQPDQSISGVQQPPVADGPQLFKPVDDEAQQSIKNTVVISPPTTEASLEVDKVDEVPSTEGNADVANNSHIHLLENNEIALYFNNNPVETVKDQQAPEDPSQTKNDQQYGSYVSFENPSTSYVYGDLRQEQPSRQ